MKQILAIFGYGWLCGLGLMAQIPSVSESGPTSTVRTATILASDSTGSPLWTGGGFFVSDDGMLATARHLIRDAYVVAGKTGAGETFQIVGVVADDPIHDLVILKTDIKRTTYMPLGSFDQLRVKQEVKVVGNMHSFNGRIIKGIIRQIENLAGDYQWYAIDANAVEGLSGSPVLGSKGEIVGLMTGQLYEHTMGFVLSVDSIKQLLKQAAEKPALIPVTKLKRRRYNELFEDIAFKDAIAAFGRNDHKEAIHRIETAKTHFPNCAVLYALEGSFYSAMKSWTKAERAYHQAIELKPKYAMAWAYLSAVLTYQGRANEAIEAAVTATKLRPDIPEAWLNLGSTYVLSKRFEDARKVLKQLRSMDDENAARMASALETLLARTAPKE